MKYQIGDRVRIKSIDWYNENKSKRGDISFPYKIKLALASEMSSFCGQIVTISQKDYIQDIEFYRIKEDECVYMWTDEMIECKVEDENNDCEKCSLTCNSTKCLFMDNCPHNKQKNIIEIPKDYVLKDENGNVINATKIVLEKKKKEYPKTFEECCNILGFLNVELCFNADYRSFGASKKQWKRLGLMNQFYQLLICRDAYWKIAGEEMGLGKPWEPDWDNVSDKYCIYFVSGYAWSKQCQTRQCPFAFPTPEMRDAFYENFKELIEYVKELL